MFHDKIQALINLIENWLSKPEDNVQLEQWVESANELAYSYEFSEIEQIYIGRTPVEKLLTRLNDEKTESGQSGQN